MVHRSRTPASEFPNDNPELHDGAIWVCLEPCGPLRAETRAREDRPSMVLPAGTHLREEAEREEAEREEAEREGERHGAPPSLAELAEDLGIDVEDGIVIEELAFFDPPAHAAIDPFSTFVATLADVARGAGDARAAAVLPGLLCDGLLDSETISAAAIDALREGGCVEQGASGPMASASLRATAGAWCRVLRGESEDIAACGAATLDEWAADVLARVLGAPARATLLRRELRSRGIAAFGLLDAA